MERTVTATEARVHFGEMMRRVVDNQEAIVVARAGKPVIVMLSIAEYERLKAGRTAPPDWLARAQAIREAVADYRAGEPLPPADDVRRELREERDDDLLDLR